MLAVSQLQWLYHYMVHATNENHIDNTYNKYSLNRSKTLISRPKMRLFAIKAVLLQWNGILIMREPQSFNSTMELMSCDVLQFTAIYPKKKSSTPVMEWNSICWFDYDFLTQKVIKDVHHYNAIWHSMSRYVICCDNNFCKRVICKGQWALFLLLFIFVR